MPVSPHNEHLSLDALLKKKHHQHSRCVYKPPCVYFCWRTLIPIVWSACALAPLCSPVINIFCVCHNRAHLTRDKSAHGPRGPAASDSPLHIIRSAACQPHTVLETVTGSTSFTDKRRVGMSGRRTPPL